MPRGTPDLTQLLTADEVRIRVEDLARRLAPTLDDDTIAVCLLIGGLWFAADLTRALANVGRSVAFDALWLSSYGESRESAGRCDRLAGPQRSVEGRPTLIIDDVIDSGLSLLEARRLLLDSGASRVTTAVFARKPWPNPREIEPDFVAWEAPARFLVGYGMDDAGGMRGFPGIAAVDGLSVQPGGQRLAGQHLGIGRT